MATVLNTKLMLSAICIAALATGCSRNESQPAPAPVAPQENVTPKPQPEPQPAPKSEPAPEASNPQQPTAPENEQAKSEQQEKPQAQPSTPESKPQVEPEQAPIVEAPKAEQEQPSKQEPTTIQSKVQAASKKYGFPILVAQALKSEDVEQGLETLTQVMAKVQEYHAKKPAKEGETPRLEPLFDYLVLSSKNEPITEHREDLRVKLDTAEDVSRATSMLKYEFLNCEQQASGEPKSAERFKGCKEFYRTRHIEAFRKARTDLNAVRKALPEFTIKCGAKGNLPVETCAAGARTFQAVHGLVNKEVMSSIKTVVLTSRNPFTVLVPVSVRADQDGTNQMTLMYMANPQSVARQLHSDALKALEQRR